MNLDFILGLMLSSLAAAGKPKALELLQKEHDKNEADYKAIIYLGNALLLKAKDLTSTTSTNLDDQGVAAAMDILSASASQNGLIL